MSLDDKCGEGKIDQSRIVTGKNRDRKIVETKVCTVYTGSVAHCRFLGGYNSLVIESSGRGLYVTKRYWARCYKGVKP